MSLPARSISSFDDLETMFLTMYAPPVAYHTLLTQFTQIRLKKGERIRDFNFLFLRTLNQIQEEQKPNAPVILRMLQKCNALKCENFHQGCTN
jgi:hypothetical protein